MVAVEVRLDNEESIDLNPEQPDGYNYTWNPEDLQKLNGLELMLEVLDEG